MSESLPSMTMGKEMRSTPAKPDQGLRLRAVDADDLAIIAACFQDALIPLNEMAYLAEEGRFMGAFTRFCREALHDPEKCDSDGLMQCQSVLAFGRVEGVRFRGLDPRFARVRLELLTIVAEPAGEGLTHITLVFAGDVAIQLRTRGIAARMQDFGERWPARCAPAHGFATAAAGEA